jgi:hypothetical protein
MDIVFHQKLLEGGANPGKRKKRNPEMFSFGTVPALTSDSG